jgi:RNA polymerase sigma factor (TIGR02999 family)
VKTTLRNDPGEITRLLLELKTGSSTAKEELIRVVYKELRRIAAIRLRGEAAHHSLQPTALVNEAYLRFAQLREIDWQSRNHFFAVAATLMRRVLVDHARARRASKRGDGAVTLSLNDLIYSPPKTEPEILALDDALERLAQLDERQSKIVELRFFAGMSEEETAQILGISVRTVKRDWRAAKAWLFDDLRSRDDLSG